MGILRNLAANALSKAAVAVASGQQLEKPEILAPHDIANLEGETVAVQKVHKLIYDSITKGYFDMDSVRIISGIIERLKYAQADKALKDLYEVLDVVYRRNFNEYGECTCDDGTPDELMARDACIRFYRAVEARENDGLGPYRGKSFDVTGTFKFGTQAEVIERVKALGLSTVPGSPTTYYPDYIFIGCKPTKRHPSEDFSDYLKDGVSRVKGEDGFYRSYVLEYDFEPLK